MHEDVSENKDRKVTVPYTTGVNLKEIASFCGLHLKHLFQGKKATHCMNLEGHNLQSQVKIKSKKSKNTFVKTLCTLKYKPSSEKRFVSSC